MALYACVCLAFIAVTVVGLAQPPVVTGDTFAVIVSTSRFWFNYRHAADALAVYHAMRRLGVPDSRIVLMLAENPASSAHNPTPGRVYAVANDREGGDVLSEDAQVDYAGSAVTPDALVRVLTGRHHPGTPRSQRLSTGPASRVLLYLTGHGGDGFLKFHDKEELASEDLAVALRSAEAAGRFGEVLLLLDTCQAATLTEPLGTTAGDVGAAWRRALRTHDGADQPGLLAGWPWDALSQMWQQHPSPTPPPSLPFRSRVGIIALGSSLRGEDSLGAQADAGLGMAVADEFSQLVYAVLRSAFNGAFAPVSSGSSAVAWDPSLPSLQVTPPGPAYSELLRGDWERWRATVERGKALAAAEPPNSSVGAAVVGARLLSGYCDAVSEPALLLQSPERVAVVRAWCAGRAEIAGFQRRGLSAACATGKRGRSGGSEALTCDASLRAKAPGRLYDPGPHLAIPALEAMLQQQRRPGVVAQAPSNKAESQPSLLRLWPAQYQRLTASGIGHPQAAAGLPRVSSSVSVRIDLVSKSRVAAESNDGARSLGDLTARILRDTPLLDFFGAVARPTD